CFSSRRRHTSFSRDWSSDVCSSDLRHRARMEMLATLMAAHFREQRPVGFYASALGISPTHLNRMTRTTTGHSVQELLALQIVERSEERRVGEEVCLGA